MIFTYKCGCTLVSYIKFIAPPRRPISISRIIIRFDAFKNKCCNVVWTWGGALCKIANHTRTHKTSKPPLFPSLFVFFSLFFFFFDFLRFSLIFPGCITLFTGFRRSHKIWYLPHSIFLISGGLQFRVGSLSLHVLHRIEILREKCIFLDCGNAFRREETRSPNFLFFLFFSLPAFDFSSHPNYVFLICVCFDIKVHARALPDCGNRPGVEIFLFFFCFSVPIEIQWTNEWKKLWRVMLRAAQAIWANDWIWYMCVWHGRTGRTLDEGTVHQDSWKTIDWLSAVRCCGELVAPERHVWDNIRPVKF